MVRLRSERFSLGTMKKLHARGAGLFKIIKKIGSNAYVVDHLLILKLALLLTLQILPPIKNQLGYLVSHLSLNQPLRANLSLSVHQPKCQQNMIRLREFWMSRSFPPGVEAISGIWSDGEVDRSLKIPGSLEKSCNALISIYLSITRAKSTHTRQGRVSPISRELVQTPEPPKIGNMI